jgi:hypothetical protein
VIRFAQYVGLVLALDSLFDWSSLVIEHLRRILLIFGLLL